jgi:hypothetical protein
LPPACIQEHEVVGVLLKPGDEGQVPLVPVEIRHGGEADKIDAAAAFHSKKARNVVVIPDNDGGAGPTGVFSDSFILKNIKRI